MEHYDEYLRDYPLSEEEAADIARVREYMERPPTLEEAVEQLSPEERKEFAASLQAFLDFGLDGSE
jgi:DNA-binding GntR family transcriptional regulator